MDATQCVIAVDMASEAEVTHFQLVCLGLDQQVFGLDIAMHNVLRVEVVNSLEYLIDEQLYALTIEAFRLFF